MRPRRPSSTTGWGSTRSPGILGTPRPTSRVAMPSRPRTRSGTGPPTRLSGRDWPGSGDVARAPHRGQRRDVLMARAMLLFERQNDISWEPTIVILATPDRLQGRALPGNPDRDARLARFLSD